MLRKSLLVLAVVAAASAPTAAFAAGVSNPALGTNCLGVSAGSTSVTPGGGVSHNGDSFYFNGVSSCT